MDTTEAKVRCIEVAATLSARLGDYSVGAVVEIATGLYDFVVAPPPAETQAVTADKPGKKRQAKEPDILS